MDSPSLAHLCRLPVPATDPVAPVIDYMETIGQQQAIEPIVFATGELREDRARATDDRPWGPFHVPVAGS